jgi:hypothetical protein
MELEAERDKEIAAITSLQKQAAFMAVDLPY